MRKPSSFLLRCPKYVKKIRVELDFCPEKWYNSFAASGNGAVGGDLEASVA
jgi:hypothetical protein